MTTNFEYPIVIKIHEVLIYGAQGKMKPNVASVPCELDGGNRVRLGLELSSI